MQERKVNKRLSDGLPARIRLVSYPQQSFSSTLTKYFRVIGGVFLAITLLLPLFWIPALVILVLPTEVYLLDWVHTQYTKSLVRMSRFDKSSESEYAFEEAERKRDAISRNRHWEFAR